MKNSLFSMGFRYSVVKFATRVIRQKTSSKKSATTLETVAGYALVTNGCVINGVE